MSRFITTLLLCLAALVSVHAPVHAKGAREGAERIESPAPAVTRAGVSLDQAVAMMQSKYQARVNRAVTTERNGRVVHEIRLISADGARVWTVHVDAATGREL